MRDTTRGTPKERWKRWSRKGWKSWGWVFILFTFPFAISSAEGERAAFQVTRGTNISHWLSQSSRRGEERRGFFQREDVAYLASLGFDHLRIPVDEEQLWHEDGAINEEAFRLLESALDWCEDFHLRAIVDLHILRSHHFNEDERPLWTERDAQERFFQCWEDLSSRIGGRPVSMVAYELMNEPVAEDPSDWNELIAEAVARIRLREPERVLVIGSNRWQSVHTFDELRIPSEDPNILLSFHFYIPMALTHYQAGWTAVGEYSGPVRYPGRVIPEADFEELPSNLKEAARSSAQVYDREVIAELIQKPLHFARRHGLPLYCGEWGVYHEAPEGPRLRWYQDVRSVLEEHDIGWATWDYKGGFGIIDEEGRPVLELIETLTGDLSGEGRGEGP